MMNGYIWATMCAILAIVIGLAGIFTPDITNLQTNITDLQDQVNTLTTELSETQKTDLAHGLVLWLPFDGVVNDKSGFSNDNVDNNIVFDSGYFERSAYFGGVDSYVRSATNDGLDFEVLTIAFWVKLNNTVGYQWIFGRGASPEARCQINNAYIWRIDDFYINSVSRSSEVFFSFSTDWHFCVFIYDGDYMRFFVDTVSVGNSSQYSGVVTLSINNGWDFGSGTYYGYVNPLDGWLDDVRVYNRVLSEYEISKLYNLGV